MRYAQTTAPTAGSMAVSLARCVEHLQIVADDQVAYVQGLVDKAVRWVERRIDRQLLPATWTLYLDRFPAEIELQKLPVTSVEEIRYTDTAGVAQTLAADQYQVSLASPDHPARVKPAAGLRWPDTASDTYDAVQVEFEAGYAAIPETLQHAILLLVAEWFEHREPTSGQVLNMAPFAVESLIACEATGFYR